MQVGVAGPPPAAHVTADGAFMIWPVSEVIRTVMLPFPASGWCTK